MPLRTCLTEKLGASGEDPVRTSTFDAVRGYSWPDGIMGRALRNHFTGRWQGRERELAGMIDGEMDRYRAAAARADFDTAVVFTGEGADLIDDVPSAGEIVTRLVADAERALGVAGKRVVSA